MTAAARDNAAFEFLTLACPDGPWALTAIRIDRKAIDTKTFWPHQPNELADWLTRYNGDRNIYWSVNPPIKEITKKAEREDIKEVAFLHVDIDPRVGEDAEAEKVRILELFAGERPASLPLPTAVVFSGGGYQAFWKLTKPIPINGDLALAEDAKLYNLKIEQLLGGDNCHDISRIMRLPGTINVPDERKKRKGRVPELARLVAWNADAVYPLDKFAKAVVTAAGVPASFGPAASTIDTANLVRLGDVAELDKYGVPDDIKIICNLGSHPDKPKEGDNSRSIWVMHAVCGLLRARVPNEIILSILTDSNFRISESILEKGNGAERYALRQITRGQEKVDESDLEFDLDNTGVPFPTAKNIRRALCKERVSLRYNLFSRRYEVFGMQGENIVTRAVINKLWLDIEKRYNFRPKKDFFSDVLLGIAYDNPYHPLRDEFDDLEWDGVDRLSTWLTVYLGAKDTPLIRAIGEIFLTAQVRRVRDPGCKFDEMLVLEGPQGGEKSTVIEVWLAIGTGTLAMYQCWPMQRLSLNGCRANQSVKCPS